MPKKGAKHKPISGWQARVMTSGVEYNGLQLSKRGTAEGDPDCWELTLNVFGDCYLIPEDDILAVAFLKNWDDPTERLQLGDTGDLSSLKHLEVGKIYTGNALKQGIALPSESDYNAVRVFVRRGAPCAAISHTRFIAGEEAVGVLCPSPPGR